MRVTLFAALMLAIAGPFGAAVADEIPKAIYTDPAPDPPHPARMAVLHIPSHGLTINGVAYVASGPQPHPTAILLHGLPGNEKNLDLAQAIRRAGWNVVTFNYRGSWGSPGVFSFNQNLEDCAAVLDYVRDPANVQTLGVDLGHVVLIGHSMGGWVAANTAGHDKGVAGLITISAADMAGLGHAPQAIREKVMAANMEALSGVTARSMAEDIAGPVSNATMPAAAPGLVDTPYLALMSEDGLASNTDALVGAIQKLGGKQVTAVHVATDHSWSDHRVALEAAIIEWLQKLTR